MRAAIYARYSDENQREESIHAQIRASKEYCAKKGYSVVKIYADEAKTGKTDKRPDFQRMLRESQLKLFDILVVHKVNRFARNRISSAINKSKLIKAGVRLEYVEFQLDGSPESVMMEAVLEGMAEYYSLDLAREVMKGMKENAYQAKFNGGYAPYGYTIQNGKYVINDLEATAIRLIYDMYLAGEGYGAISDELERQGYKTRFGKKFGKTSLYGILANPRYSGTYTFNKVNTRPDGTRNTRTTGPNMIKLENAIPAIISPGEFKRVEEKMRHNKKRTGAYKANEFYLLSGLARCGDCGAVLVGKTTYMRGKKYQYYRCGAQERRTAIECNSKTIVLSDLEHTVIEQVENAIFAPGRVEELIRMITRGYEERTGTIEAERSALEKQKNATARKLDNLYSRIEEGSADEYDLDRLKKVKEEMTAIRFKLSELETREIQTLSAEQVEKVINSYRAAIKGNSPKHLRAMLVTFVERVTVSADEIVIRMKVNCDMYGAGEGT